MTEELSDEALLNAIRGITPMTNNQASALMDHMSGSNIIYHLLYNRNTLPYQVLENYFAGNFCRSEIATIIELSPKWVDGVVQVGDITKSVIDSANAVEIAWGSGDIKAMEKAIDDFDRLLLSN